VAARAAGVSAWQFLAPAIASAFSVGVIMITTINPIACAMVAKYSQLEGKYMHGQISALAISSSGLWLRQRNNADAKNPTLDKGESIIHALRVGQKDDELYDVTIFVFTNQDKFIQRVDAKKAKLANGFWHLSDTVITLPDKPAVRQPEYFLETELTLDQIHNSFAAPETISFWSLPGFINTLQEAGFSALRHRQHWHATLASPIFYAAMVLIAAVFSLQLPRHSKTSLLITACIITGFIIYFMTDIISALGLSGKLPIIVSAWVPVMLTLLAGVAPILHYEDG
jgi:lipopolysaccharide export system permease protein